MQAFDENTENDVGRAGHSAWTRIASPDPNIRCRLRSARMTLPRQSAPRNNAAEAESASAATNASRQPADDATTPGTTSPARRDDNPWSIALALMTLQTRPSDTLCAGTPGRSDGNPWRPTADAATTATPCRQPTPTERHSSYARLQA